ncbi:MAG TPA: hypothetical protein VEQ63_01100 [Bryobacteraceae bacterium]|nr:hypothetical protein [Bryobacteraceae bacterium]
MSPRIKQAIIIGSFALLAVLAVAGWTRRPEANLQPNHFNNAYVGPNRQVYGQPAPMDPALYGQPVAAQQRGPDPAYAHSAAYSPAYAQNCEPSAPVQSVAYQAPVNQTRYRTYSRPRVARSYDVVERRDYVVRKNRRSTGKSVAIVAGSAGTGAAIGALAGGGKGAALGALSGGAAGFIYDRLTHNR